MPRQSHREGKGREQKGRKGGDSGLDHPGKWARCHGLENPGLARKR